MAKLFKSRFHSPTPLERAVVPSPSKGAASKQLAQTAIPRRHLLDSKEAAAYLKVEVATLADWRHKQKGPRWIPLSRRRVLYDLEDLNEFLDERKRSISS